MTMPKSMDELGKTILPASFFEQNIVTAVKENLDPEELERNRTLTRTKTPAQLAAINSISDIPVPDKIKNILSSSGSEKKAPEATKKRRYNFDACMLYVAIMFHLYSVKRAYMHE